MGSNYARGLTHGRRIADKARPRAIICVLCYGNDGYRLSRSSFIAPTVCLIASPPQPMLHVHHRVAPRQMHPRYLCTSVRDHPCHPRSHTAHRTRCQELPDARFGSPIRLQMAAAVMRIWGETPDVRCTIRIYIHGCLVPYPNTLGTNWSPIAIQEQGHLPGRNPLMAMPPRLQR